MNLKVMMCVTLLLLVSSDNLLRSKQIPMFDENGKKIIKRKTPMKLVHHQNWYTALLQDLVL